MLPVSSFIYYFSRAMFHLKSESWNDIYFEDLVDSVFSHMSNYMTYEFIDIYEFFVEMIASIHYETKYLRYTLSNDEPEQVTDEIVKANKL